MLLFIHLSVYYRTFRNTSFFHCVDGRFRAQVYLPNVVMPLSPLGQRAFSTRILMPQSGDLNPPRLSTGDAFLELLTDTIETLEQPSRGQFLQRFFRSIAHVELSEPQSVDVWEQALARKNELSENVGKKVALQAALVDVLASGNFLRLPIVMDYEQLRQLQINAATDPLTGLYNRRFFDDYFERELNRAIRYSHRLALVVFDLHRFKEVNDRYGHPQGDVLLQMAAVTLRKSLRTSDYAFRIGGDEFALLLPQSDTEQAAALSRRLRTAYAGRIEPLRLGVPLALDYGLAVYPDDGEKKAVLIGVADERLYQLKKVVRPLSPTGPASTGNQPATAEKKEKEVVRPARFAGETPQTPGAESSTLERRRWDRVSLAGTRAYAVIGEGVERTARVLDLCYGGVALEMPRTEELEETFQAMLHVPILPPVRVSLRRVYQTGGDTNVSRMGCSFVT
jgi:diguanylate cyclase (GGDEF)-like protein